VDTGNPPGTERHPVGLCLGHFLGTEKPRPRVHLTEIPDVGNGVSGEGWVGFRHQIAKK